MKMCPVCGAGAFDDAEVCFGCLHRYEKDESGRADRAPGTGVPGAVSALGASTGAVAGLREAPAPGFQPQGAVSAARQPAPAAVQASAAVAQAVREPLSQPSAQALPVRQEARVAEAVPLATAEALEAPQVPVLFDGAGWVVRFEFPGFVPAPPEGRGMGAAGDGAGALGRGCSLLAENRSGAEGRACGVVVRFQPEPAGALEERSTCGPSRGSHAREPTEDNRLPAGSERS